MEPLQWLDLYTFQAEGAAELGDKRRTKRLQNSMQEITLTPSSSFPEIFHKKAALEGFYRLVENPAVFSSSILSPHVEQTLKRCADIGAVLVIHDTTDVSFDLYDPELRRKNLSRVSTRKQGFYTHLTMAVADTPLGIPLGTLNAQSFVHKKHVKDETEKAFWTQIGGYYDNERQRWFDAIRKTDAELRVAGASGIHVMDREADSYSMFSWLHQEDIHYVLRVSNTKRRVYGSPKMLNDVLNDKPFVAEAKVFLGARGPLRPAKALKRQPPRKARNTTLRFRAVEVTIQRGGSSGEGYTPITKADLPQQLTMHLVEAIEVEPPQGESPVRWLLLTSEPIETPEQVIRVIDIYRKRWIIEEFFKVLKTGCRLESRQMESAHTLLNVLAILLPVAWRLLMIRSLDDASPKEHWSTVLEPLAFHVLKKAVPQSKLHNNATVKQVILAIASLGGHLKQNGDPGWLVLLRGWRKLSDYVQGAQLASTFERDT